MILLTCIGTELPTIFLTVSEQSPTWSPDIDIHAVILNLALRGSGSNGGDAQVSGVQVLLRPLPVVRLVAHLQYSLLVKLLEQGQQEVRQLKLSTKR